MSYKEYVILNPEASSLGFVLVSYMGGTYFEQKSGEKLSKIKPYYESYKQQING